MIAVSDDDTTGGLGGHPAPARLFHAGQRVRQWDAARPWALDTFVVIAIFLVFCLPDLSYDGDPPDAPIPFARPPLAKMLLFQATLLVPLWWRRRAPLVAFHAVMAAFVVQLVAGVLLRADVALLVAVYSVVLHAPLRRLPWAVPTSIATFVLLVIRLATVLPVGDLVFLLLSIGVAAAALGFAVRVRRAQLAALRDRARQLEIERDQRSRLAAAGERARMAREMHDIVGHSLAVIIALADGGAYAVDVAPERGKEALNLIGDTSRRSLGELRRILGVLRDRAEEPDLSPQPRVVDLDALCQRVRAAGPRVEYRSTGELDALDLGVQLAAYRIVQEALTNVLKHAGPHTRVRLALRIDGTRLRITVRDTGPPDASPPDAADRPTLPGEPDHGEPGHGLIGMRERAGLYGGAVTAGPAPGGGWNVAADLDLTPLRDPESGPT